MNPEHQRPLIQMMKIFNFRIIIINEEFLDTGYPNPETQESEDVQIIHQIN